MLVARPDAGTAPRGQHPDGMSQRHAHLALDLDLEAQPVSGRIEPEGAAPLSFTGYASLIAALEELRTGSRESGEDGGEEAG